MRLRHLVLVCAVLEATSISQGYGWAQPAPVEALTVCEAVKNLHSVVGKPFAFVGRLSFRRDGEWISEEDCGAPGQDRKTAVITLEYDTKDAPRVKTGWEVNGSTMRDKLALVRRSTKLVSFPFGTSDYDRWAVVYGCLKLPDAGAKPADKKAAAELLYAGDGYVLVVK